MKLLETSRKTLDLAQYFTISRGEEDLFYFEDNNLYGFVWIAPVVEAIIGEWEKRQDAFLAGHEKQLRRLKEKTWNAYSVLLCEGDPNEDQRNVLSKIEDDLRGSRKLVGVSLRTNSQVVRTLFPLLQIQNLVVLQDANPIERLRSRLTPLAPGVLDSLFGEAPTADVVDRLLSENENS